MEAPYLLTHYDKESHQLKDDDYQSKYHPDHGYKHISTMKSGHDVIKQGLGSPEKPGFASYMAVDHMHKVHIKVDGRHEGGRFRIHNLTGHQKSKIKAHEFYHHLLKHFSLQSDNTHSKGGAHAWRQLSKMPGVQMKHVNKEGKRIKLDKKNWTANYHSVDDNNDGPTETKPLSYSRFVATRKKDV